MTTNMNNQITGGSVTVEDGLKAKEEYAPARKIAVTLNFSTPEGGDGIALLDFVSAVANGRQLALLHGKAPAPAEATAKLETPAPDTAKVKTTRAKTLVVPAEKTKDDLAREAGVLVDDLDEAPKKAAVAEEKDELADLLGDTPAVVVSDAELGKAAQEKNGDMKGKAGWAPEKIRELVGTYVQVDGKPKPGAKLQEIPQAQRSDFLKVLKALK